MDGGHRQDGADLDSACAELAARYADFDFRVVTRYGHGRSLEAVRRHGTGGHLFAVISADPETVRETLRAAALPPGSPRGQRSGSRLPGVFWPRGAFWRPEGARRPEGI